MKRELVERDASTRLVNRSLSERPEQCQLPFIVLRTRQARHSVTVGSSFGSCHLRRRFGGIDSSGIPPAATLIGTNAGETLTGDDTNNTIYGNNQFIGGERNDTWATTLP
jgi:hypothetical protein